MGCFRDVVPIFFLDFSGIWFDLNRPGKLDIVGFCYRFLLCKSWQERITSCLQEESEDTDTGWMTYVALHLYNTFRIPLHFMTQILCLPSQCELGPELCHSWVVCSKDAATVEVCACHGFLSPDALLSWRWNAVCTAKKVKTMKCLDHFIQQTQEDDAGMVYATFKDLSDLY